jgi:cytochrome oxidase Cu insertion factor (SCO1/SenC/PrrC family)
MTTPTIMWQRRQALLALVCTGLVGLTPRVRAAPASAYQLDLNFTDDHGVARELAHWQGRTVVIAMAYGACRSVCSTTLRTLEELQAVADRKQLDADFLVVSIDPVEDTPQAWAQYRQARRLDRANWSFLCGSVGDTRRLARFLGTKFWRYDEHVMHDFRIVRLARDGSIEAAMDWQHRDTDVLL